jgi:hypothetical protein
MKRAARIAITLSASLFSCSQGLGAEDLVAQTFSVGDTTFSITLPKEAKIAALPQPAGGVRIDFTRRTDQIEAS